MLDMLKTIAVLGLIVAFWVAIPVIGVILGTAVSLWGLYHMIRGQKEIQNHAERIIRAAQEGERGATETAGRDDAAPEEYR